MAICPRALKHTQIYPSLSKHLSKKHFVIWMIAFSLKSFVQKICFVTPWFLIFFLTQMYWVYDKKSDGYIWRFFLPLGYCRHETPVLSKPIEVIHLSEDLVVLDKPCSLPVSSSQDNDKFLQCVGPA